MDVDRVRQLNDRCRRGASDVATRAISPQLATLTGFDGRHRRRLRAAAAAAADGGCSDARHG